MDIRLCNDEQVVKSWDYATEGSLLDRSVANITVTNKRVISTVQGRKRIRRAEVPVEAVKRMNVVSTKKAPILISFVLIVIGLLLADMYFMQILPIPAIISGVLFVGAGIIALFFRKRAFKLSITITPSEVVGISAGRTTQKKVNKRQKSGKEAKSASSKISVAIVVLAVYFVYLLTNVLSRSGATGAGSGFASIMILNIILYAIIILAIMQRKIKKGYKKVKIEKTVSHTRGLKLHFKKEVIDEIANEIGAVVLNAKALNE